MKRVVVAIELVFIEVTPYAGVWIETLTMLQAWAIKSGSLPTRECGLKLFLVLHVRFCCTSLPTREGGLKLLLEFSRACSPQVTPYAGVWIETSLVGIRNMLCSCVTPYAGVWIETFSTQRRSLARSASLPTRECGLKHIAHHHGR